MYCSSEKSQRTLMYPIGADLLPDTCAPQRHWHSFPFQSWRTSRKGRLFLIGWPLVHDGLAVFDVRMRARPSIELVSRREPVYY